MKQYELSQEQLNRILEASKPVPYIIFGGYVPESPQEKANRVWRALGKEMGFDWKTVRPISKETENIFQAEPLSLEDCG